MAQIESRSGGKPSSRKLFLEKIPYDSLPCVRGEQVHSCLSGLPQKSHGEFCGKRSGRRIRSCGKRSAPQTKPPCRDEVGSLPHANLETAYYPCRFRAPAQMRSRCVGRGDASRAVKPRGTQRRTCWLCGDESAVSTARDGVRRGTSLTEGLLSPHFGLLFGGAQALP